MQLSSTAIMACKRLCYILTALKASAYISTQCSNEYAERISCLKIRVLPFSSSDGGEMGNPSSARDRVPEVGGQMFARVTPA